MMTPLKRRQFYARAGFAPAIPPLSVQRSWQYIDDRVPPETEPDGQFTSYIQWVNKASSWIGWTGAKCFDALNRPCRNGGDFMRARDEDTFPVLYYFPEHFASPVIPTNGEIAAMRYLQQSPKADIRDIRKVPGAGNMTWKRIAALIGEENVSDGDNERRITAEGLNLTHEYAERARRASYVR